MITTFITILLLCIFACRIYRSFKNNLRDAQHSLVYENQMKHPSWAKTTKEFKQYILNTYNQIKTK
jgi:hypothetical protein